MTEKLKDKIKKEIERVDRRIINLQTQMIRGNGKTTHEIRGELDVLNEWSQSLHEIDSICSERNRY